MSKNIEVLGYHTSHRKNYELINREGFKISRNTKTKSHWLGDGIYLFKYPADAKSWGVRIDNCKADPITIRVKACINDSDILDLDNPEDMDKLKCFTQKVYEKLAKETSLRFESEKDLISLGINLYRKSFQAYLVKYTFRQSMVKASLGFNDFTSYIFKKDRKSINYGYNQVQYCLEDNRYIVEKLMYEFGE